MRFNVGSSRQLIIVLCWIALALSGLNIYVGWESPRFAYLTSSPLREHPSPYVMPRRDFVPLPELTGSNKTVQCQEGLIPIYDVLADSKLVFQKRRIPRIVHLTSKSRCVHPDLAKNVEKWKLKGHSLFFHDDEAMDKLLYRDWPEFPEFKYVLKCLLYGGAAKADIWRELVLWEYGGIYADVDSYPHPEKFNENTIKPHDDAFFVIEKIGAASQWFMVASPRHPMIYFNIRSILVNMITLEDIGQLPIIWALGPGAVIQGFQKFLGRQPVPDPLAAGVYRGAYGRTVKLVGSADNENEYIERSIYGRKGKDENPEKEKLYASMGMQHFSTFGHIDESSRRNESCMWRMWRNEMRETMLWEPTW